MEQVAFATPSQIATHDEMIERRARLGHFRNQAEAATIAKYRVETAKMAEARRLYETEAKATRLELERLYEIKAERDKLYKRLFSEAGGPTKQIIDIVCKHYKVTKTDLLSQRKDKWIVTPRHVAFWLCKNTTNYSWPDIARQFNRDHTTAMHGVSRIDHARVHHQETLTTTDALLAVVLSTRVEQ